MPADAVVRYDTSQSLNANQRLQARTNIGAVGTTDISGLSTTDSLLEARIAQLEVSSFTQDQIDSVVNAEGDGENPLVSTTSVQTLLDTKADTIHLHEIFDINGLESSLDLKSEMGHTHSISDITNFSAGDYVSNEEFDTAIETLTNSKADTEHSHQTLDGLYVAALLVPSVSFTDGTVMTTAQVPFEDAPSDGNYYLRINGSWVAATIVVETINGTQYSIVTI
jgi:hypothetical protein